MNRIILAALALGAVFVSHAHADEASCNVTGTDNGGNPLIIMEGSQPDRDNPWCRLDQLARYFPDMPRQDDAYLLRLDPEPPQNYIVETYAPQLGDAP